MIHDQQVEVLTPAFEILIYIKEYVTHIVRNDGDYVDM